MQPNNASVYYYRGTAYAASGNYKSAIADYTKAIKLYPNYAIAYNNRGFCYKKLGDTARAQADFDKAKQLGYNG